MAAMRARAGGSSGVGSTSGTGNTKGKNPAQELKWSRGMSEADWAGLRARHLPKLTACDFSTVIVTDEHGGDQEIDVVRSTIGQGRPWEWWPLLPDLAVPYRPVQSATRNVLVAGANGMTELVITPGLPAHVELIESMLDRPQYSTTLEEGLKTGIAKTILKESQPGVVVRETSGRIRMSRTIGKHEIYFDADGVVLNEAVCLAHAWDADGDNFSAIKALGPDDDLVDGVQGWMPGFKNPITRTVRAFKRTSVLKSGTWLDFSVPEYRHAMEDPSTTPKDLDVLDVFEQCHKGLPLGIVTSTLATEILFKTASDHLRWRIQQMPNPRLYDALEGDLMKARSKGGEFKIADLSDVKFRLPVEARWALTNTGSINGMVWDDLKWIQRAGAQADGRSWFAHHVENLTRLRWHAPWMRKKDAPKADPQADPSAIPMVEPEGDLVLDGSFVQRLINMGFLVVEDIPHTCWTHDAQGQPVRCLDGEGQPINAVLMTVQNIHGEDVALTDLKRTQGVVEGISWTVVLLPVWSALHARMLSPTEWLQYCMAMRVDSATGEHKSGVDSVIRSSNSLECTPISDWRFLLDERWPYKLGSLMRFLQNHCGVYGDVPPVVINDGQHDLSDIGLFMAQSTVIVDYGAEQTWENMWRVWQVARQDTMIVPASKGDDRRVRKYAVAAANGLHPRWDEDGVSNYKRSSQIRSQLSRGLKKCVMTVAIMLPASLIVEGQVADPDAPPALHQVLITPTGMDKQNIRTAFGRRITHRQPTEEELAKGDWEPVVYPGIRGEQRVCWSAGPKQTTAVGKLVDKHGQKFVSLRTGQAHYGIERGAGHDIDWQPIDLLMPVHELIAKDLHRHFLGKARAHKVRLADGQEVIAWVVTMVLYRTGAANENFPLRRKTRFVRGTDAHMVCASLHRISDWWLRTHGHGDLSPEEIVQHPDIPLDVKSAFMAAVEAPNVDYVEALLDFLNQVPTLVKILTDIAREAPMPNQEQGAPVVTAMDAVQTAKARMQALRAGGQG